MNGCFVCSGDTNLIHAAKGGHRGIVEALIKRHADVDIRGKDSKVSNRQAFFGHLARNPLFDNVTSRSGYSQGLSQFLPMPKEWISFSLGLILKEKGIF